MSYINDALKKAQQERDGRYERFGGIISSGPVGQGQPRKRKLAIDVAVMLLVLIPAGVLLVVSVLQQPSPVKKTPPQPVIVGNPAALPSMAPQAAEKPVTEAVPAGTTPGGPQAGKAAVPEVGTAAAVQKGKKPVGSEAEVRYTEALLAQRKGDLREAERLYLAVLALDPGHVRTLNNLGVLCLVQKRRERAIALFSKAIVLKKDYVDPYYNLACLYSLVNEIDESIRYLKVAMTINGDVKNWAEKDPDMTNVVASPAFSKIIEGQKN